MSKKNLAIPFEEFVAISMKKSRDALEEVGLKKMPYNIILYELHDLLDWKETTRIGIKDFFTGWTVPFAEGTLAKRAGCAINTVRKALIGLCEAGILEQQKVGHCYRYLIKIYSPSIEHLKAHPPKTRKIEYIDSDSGEYTEIKHTTRNNKRSASGAPLQSAKNNGMQTAQHDSSFFADNQDYKDLKGPPALNAKGMEAPRGDMTEKNGGDFKNVKDSKPKEKAKDVTKAKTEQAGFIPLANGFSETDKATVDVSGNETVRSKGSSPAPSGGADFVPNGYIERAIDEIASSKRIGADRDGRLLDEYMLVFNPKNRLIPSYKEQESLSRLVDWIERRLAEVMGEVSVPPLSFFKRCLKETEVRGEEPHSFNFFLKTPVGRDIMDYCLKQLQAERNKNSEMEKTEAYLTGLRQSGQNRHMPAEAKAALDKILRGG